MKLILIATMATLLSVNVFAKPMEAAKLEKINAYVEKEMKDEMGQDTVASFSNVNVNEETNLVDALTLDVKSTGEEAFEVSGTAIMTGNLVQLNAILSLDASEYGEFISIEMMTQMMPELNRYVTEFNEKQSDYKAAVKASVDENGASVKLTVSPISANAVSIKNFTFEMVVPADLKEVLVSIDGSFKTESDLVTEGQKSLTDMMNALANGVEPTDEVMEGFDNVIDAILKGLDMD